LTCEWNKKQSKVGYNSHMPGRPSHHPLMAFVAETRMVAVGTLSRTVRKPNLKLTINLIVSHPEFNCYTDTTEAAS
jgi:hypothetical protein